MVYTLHGSCWLRQMKRFCTPYKIAEGDAYLVYQLNSLILVKRLDSFYVALLDGIWLTMAVSRTLATSKQVVTKSLSMQRYAYFWNNSRFLSFVQKPWRYYWPTSVPWNSSIQRVWVLSFGTSWTQLQALQYECNSRRTNSTSAVKVGVLGMCFYNMHVPDQHWLARLFELWIP